MQKAGGVVGWVRVMSLGREEEEEFSVWVRKGVGGYTYSSTRLRAGG